METIQVTNKKMSILKMLRMIFYSALSKFEFRIENKLIMFNFVNYFL